MTWAVLIPCPLGYCLFVRWVRQPLRTCSAILDPADLRDAVRSLGDPLTVVLVGRRHADGVSREVLEVADLVVVPESWVRRVPRTALTQRAQIALRVAVAHLAATVEHRARAEMQVPLPF